jgi:hypothetical protein
MVRVLGFLFGGLELKSLLIAVVHGLKGKVIILMIYF